MNFLQRVTKNSKRIMRMKPAAMVPSASVRKLLPAGKWSEGKAMERLARLCNAVLDNLGDQQVLGAAYDGHKALKFAKNPAVWVGPDGGKTWRRFSAPLEYLQLEAMLTASPTGLGDVRDQGLEILDLSELEICDWKGGLVSPQVARIVLLAPSWRPSASGDPEKYFGLVLDFDQRLMDAKTAVAFMDVLANSLLEETYA